MRRIALLTGWVVKLVVECGAIAKIVSVTKVVAMFWRRSTQWFLSIFFLTGSHSRFLNSPSLSLHLLLRRSNSLLALLYSLLLLSLLFSLVVILQMVSETFPSGSSAVETVSLTMVFVSWLVGTEGSPLKSVAEAFHDDLGSLVSLSLL